VFYALVVIWTYRDLWHQHGVATGFGWDVIDTHGPDLDFLAREWREGRFSLWNPYDKGGYAVYADPVVGRFYPFAWPFTAWGAMFGVSWWLIQLEFLAHHVAAAVCMHGFLRSRGLPVRAAMIGGIGLVVSAPVLVHKGSNILWPLVWVPLVWLAIDAALARPSWRRGAGVAGAFGLCVTAGSPPGLFYAALLIVPYGVWRAATVRPAWRPLAGCAAVAAAVTAPIVALMVIPTQTLVELGTRDRWATGDAFALSLSFDWHGVMRGAFAHAAGYPEMYLGAAVVLLAACAVVQPWRDGGAPQLLVTIAIGGLILVAGATLGELPWLIHHVPGFALLRIPGRYKLVAAWGLAAAAGYGAAGLAGPRPRTALVAVAAGLAASIYEVIEHGVATARPAWWSIAAMAVPCALVAIAVCVPRLRGAMLAGLVLVVLLDAPGFTHRPGVPPAGDPRRLHERDAEILGRLDGVRDRWRLYDEFVLGERVGQRRAVRDFRGYPAVDPLTYRPYLAVLDFAKHDPAILTDFNVRWVLQGDHFRFFTTASFVPALGRGGAWDAAFVARGSQIFEAKHPAPLVAWYGAVELAGDPARALAQVRAIEQPDGARRRVVLGPDAVVRDPAVLALAAGEPAQAPASVTGAPTSYEPDAIELAIDAPRAGVVVLNELAFPGWTVEVDGAPATPLVANTLLRAVRVAPGHHAIRWRFAPPHVRALIAGYALALLVMLGAAAWPRRPRAPRP
jgi:hypothetical protein